MRFALLLALLIAPLGCEEEVVESHAASKKKKKKKKKKAPKPSCDRCGQGSCRDVDAALCHDVAKRHAHQRGLPYDMAAAARLYGIGCDNDHAPSCTALSNLQHDGVGVERDTGKAAKLAEKACDQKDGNGCLALARMHDTGSLGARNKPMAERWYARAKKTLEARCDAAGGQPCQGLAEMHRRGWGVPANVDAAFPLFEKACEDFDKACSYVALAHIRGEGTEIDVKKGRKMLDRRCKDGETSSCVALGQLLWLGKSLPAEYPRAAALLDKACTTEGDAVACGAIGMMLERGEGVAMNIETSLKRRHRACRGRNSLACYEAADMLMRTPRLYQRAQVMEFLEVGCNIGDGRQCGALGAMLKADGKESDAKARMKEACHRGIQNACAPAPATL